MKILLISNSKKLFGITNKIVSSEHELIWKSYSDLENDNKICTDIVILHFTEMMIREGSLISLIKIKIKFGRLVPILAVIEGGTAQQVFSVLRSGAYDYVDIVNNESGIYRKKIHEITMWKCYLKKYDNSQNE